MRVARLFALLLLVTPVSAFQVAEKQTTPAKTVSTKTAAASPAEEERKKLQGQARALLISLSTDARTFRDQRLRGRSLARIADALWDADTTEARAMFRKAWEAAEVADQESDVKLQEEIRQQKAKAGGGSYSYSTPPSIRRDVLRLAARRDRVLGEEFLEKLRVQKKEEATDAERRNVRSNESFSQRLSLARELLQAGELEKAAQFADPALSVITMDSVSFLSELREKSAPLADPRYAAMLPMAAADPQTDANTVSLLSSYIFTPGFYIILSDGGTSTSMRSQTIVPAEVAPALRLSFFQNAASILLRPLPVPGQPDQSTSGLEGKFLVIKRLLPLFEQAAPSELVDALRGQMNALSSLVSEGTRQRDDEWLNKGIKPDVAESTKEQGLMERIDRARTSAERDGLYLQLAMLTARNADLKAREYVSKIEESEMRKQAGAYVDAVLISRLVEKKLIDSALELAAKGDLTHLHRTWVLAECAKLVLKTDRDKALEVIDRAANEARRIEGSDPGLPRALLAVANAVKAVDPARMWDATFDAVKAANSAEGFSGEDGLLVHRFQSKGQTSTTSNTVAEFDVAGIFRDLANEDYERAVELARGFQAEGPRAVATIAIARAVLEPKKKIAAK